jgi:hypothetical protein
MNFFNKDRGKSHCGTRKGCIRIRADQARALRQDKTRKVRAGGSVVEVFVLSDLVQCAVTAKKVHALLGAGNSWPHKKFWKISR